ncbi:hypothetical protein Tco_0680579 [Tanacetum coccineum]|uniref:Uncharacterized protein n=1 Tax=Tanacetum coccineum TaxID=301880 RepID=A0ABQ4XKX0_9ASTR
MDALALTPCYYAFLITADVPEVYMHQFWDSIHKHDTFYRFKMDKRKRFKLTLEIFRDIFKICPRMHQPWRTFAALINRSLSRKTNSLDKLCLSRAQILRASLRNKIGIHTSKDEYLINTLRFVSKKEETQIYGAILPESLTSPEMKETKAYKTYLDFATRATPPKITRKIKKASPSKKDLNLNLVPVDEEPKSAKKKVPAKKTTRKQTLGVFIRDNSVESSSKRNEKYKEVCKKSLRDFHKTRLSGSGTVTKSAPSAIKIKPLVTNKGTGAKPGVPDVTEYDSTESESESWGNDKDDINDDHDLSGEDNDQENDSDDDKTQLDNENESDSVHETVENEAGFESDHQENEEEDEMLKKKRRTSDEDKEMDYTTSQLYDDVDIRLNKPVQADDEKVQKEGTDAELTYI